MNHPARDAGQPGAMDRAEADDGTRHVPGSGSRCVAYGWPVGSVAGEVPPLPGSRCCVDPGGWVYLSGRRSCTAWDLG